MLPPAPMLATKNMTTAKLHFGPEHGQPAFLLWRSKIMNRWGLIALLAAAVFLSGCGPPGPRALLKGKKLLDRGNYSAAVAEFKTATTLLSTNAQAWNYLGVAYQHAGKAADAALAYQRALNLNRDLVEVHYNLGCLWLEQNRPDLAKSEFTAYVLSRSKEPAGWTKLGVAQLRLHNLVSAEKSFSTALSLDRTDAEAFNGLGLAQMQRNRPRRAAQYFAAAKKAQPDFAPALLNLATVAQQYLHEDAFALQNYRAYLALTPRQPHWDRVNAIAKELEQKLGVKTKQARSNRPAVPTTPRRVERKPRPVAQTQSAPRPESHFSRELPPRQTAEAQKPHRPATSPSVAAKTPPRQTNEKPSRLEEFNPLNWFRSAPHKPEVTQSSLASVNANGVETKPASEPKTNRGASRPPVLRQSAKSFHMVQPAPPSFPRYLYLSPAKPKPGNRQAASREFAQAEQFQRDQQDQDALESYQAAAQLDPSWFPAQYNTGVLAYHLKHFGQSLRAYEMALAIQPDSVNARYNFALALKAGGYAHDAADQLKKILASHPDDVNAHLALGNLYAQQLYDFSQARAQYLEVLRLDPGISQAGDIQYWLSANPQ